MQQVPDLRTAGASQGRQDYGKMEVELLPLWHGPNPSKSNPLENRSCEETKDLARVVDYIAEETKVGLY
jgi:hypothetical protein